MLDFRVRLGYASLALGASSPPLQLPELAMRSGSAVALLAMLFLLPAGPASAQGFKFSQSDPAPAAEEAARQERIAQQQNYGPHFQAINARLRSLGLTTYTPEEIRRQIAQAEIDAYFRNDPDAALAAAKRLGASFVLRGLISSQAVMNPVVRVNQVSVNMGLTLTGADGRIISDTGASSSSYAGADVSGMALTLVNEQADEVVARLYGDYCRNAAPAGGSKAAPK